MIIAILAGVILISGAIAVHKYLREHPPPDLGPTLAKIYRADHPKALARAQADKKAIAKGQTVPEGALVALGHLLFGTGRALRHLGRKIRERVEAGREVPPLEIIDTTDDAAPSGGGRAAADTPAAEAEQDTPPDTVPATAPQEETPHMTVTSMAALYEASEAAAAQHFEGIVAVERFTKAVAAGCESITSVWSRWVTRLAGPLNVDETVVGHIRACAPHQATIAGLTGEVASEVTKVLDGSINDALERGQAVPHHNLMNSGGGYPAIPAYYDRFGVYITHQHDDIRGELLLMAAVKEASKKQAEMFRATARRMEDSKDINVKAGADKYYAAARTQDAITALVEAAHTQFSVIIRMTIRALTESSMRAPNANMTGVG